ncbi:Calcium/calmodulin-dependent protein kinase type 1 [Porphyridium purpureum]|uniref:Calcium/calmodulin-dependent protein kinase type 1 n=1 Tax=Porphyridium purpureum TaxID=35688 RepID=A0A5J4Z0Z3_PORPP|nr:Calcium/calmodulin-dependent protein kinase type 1 [Porphyridium purpureum]|eukprot:POR1556..scf208_2
MMGFVVCGGTRSTDASFVTRRTVTHAGSVRTLEARGFRQASKKRVQPTSHTSTRISCALARFSTSDFQILRQCGQQGYYEVTEWEYYQKRDPTQPQRTVESSGVSVRLYEAKITVGPRRNSRVLLKEFLPQGLELAVNEAKIYERLYDLTQDSMSELPVATLLGSFKGSGFSTAEFQKKWAGSFPSAGKVPDEGSPWLVFRWEGTRTLANLRNYKQTQNYLDFVFPDLAFRRKKLFLIKLISEALEAVGFLHDRGIVHRSLGPASLLVNTLDETTPTLFDCKVRDLGFAQQLSELDDQSLRLAREKGAVSPEALTRFFQNDDLKALGYSFLEIIFSFLSDEPGESTPQAESANQETFKRLFEDVYEYDLGQFRSYCEAEPRWKMGIRLLDENNGAGWSFVQNLICAGSMGPDSFKPASQLRKEHPFFKD